MNQNTTRISPEEIARQKDFCAQIRAMNAALPTRPLAYVDTYGCQQNEADSERLRGYLSEMGYDFTADETAADVIILNTCAIREHAEQRVFGNLGALVHAKRDHPGQIICVCGCMAQESHVSARIKQSFRHVDLVFGTHALWRFPELLWRIHTRRGRIFDTYGRDLGREGVDFAWLLEQVNAVPGDFLIRFMTSHPKDATERLFETMARCEKVAPALHLPFQAGNDRVLQVMNRRHTIAAYLEKVRALRALIPDIVLTSDVIVGFPGETTEEFEDTLKVLEEVRFDALFTFIYSPRKGTPAAEMPDPLSKEEKAANFQRLVDLQNAISAEKQAAYVGKTLRCLVDVLSDDPRHNLNARTAGGRLVHFSGDEALLGQYVDLRITDASTWALFGELA